MREDLKLAPEAHRVELPDYPFDAVIAPERLARDDQRRHAEDAVAFALGERIREGGRSFAGDEAAERVGVDRAFDEHRAQLVKVLEIQLALEETLEDLTRIIAKA